MADLRSYVRRDGKKIVATPCQYTDGSWHYAYEDDDGYIKMAWVYRDGKFLTNDDDPADLVPAFPDLTTWKPGRDYKLVAGPERSHPDENLAWQYVIQTKGGAWICMNCDDAGDTPQGVGFGLFPPESDNE